METIEADFAFDMLTPRHETEENGALVAAH